MSYKRNYSRIATSRNLSTSKARPQNVNSYGRPKRKKSPGWNSNT